ncbi:probable cytochrome P450 313b1 [Contarinia nasturtii]|uniref:probable cytochrome P450 313b1 n=1 Tax=Contarinia nasturtii TaxID=265458 RepID=UPI0012D47ED7|nr:probable cytochrome P450 313b1 [Contarinia nasturtii]
MIFLTSIVLLGVSVIFCLWIEIRKWYLNRTKLRAYSKLKEVPILGIGGRFIGLDNEKSMQSIDQLFYEKEQPFAAWFGPTLAIGIDSPEDMFTVLNADQCLDKPYLYSHLRNETGLFSSPKELWKQHRRALNPTFSTKIMNTFIPTFNRKAGILVERLERNIGTKFDIYRPIFKALTDSIMNTGLGMNWELQTKRGDDLHDMFMEIMSSFQSRVVRFWLKWDFVYNLTKACKRELLLLEQGSVENP